MKALKIIDLTVKINNKEILKDFNLEINSGEIHALMGPNGVGKSTLIRVIMGDNDYEITKGKIYYNNIDITNKSVSERAKMGIFMTFQMPYEIEGVTNADFLRNTVQSKTENFKLYSFIKDLETETQNLKMNKDMIHRGINSGFSGGERKKNEVLQMRLLKPSLVLLDEIDSGLDIDSLKIVSKNIIDYYKENKPTILIVSHYQKIFDYIKPDFVHVMMQGKIVKSKDASLISEIEKEGYQKFEESRTSDIKGQEKNE